MSVAGTAYVNPIASRLSLRPPQRESLEILDQVCQLIELDKRQDPQAALAILRQHFPTLQSFERDFPSLCFALATGVGKTRLMGAFIAYLFRAEQVRNFFVLAPNLTIYDKLIKDFSPNTPKYVFRGIAEFATEAPILITGDTYEGMAGHLFDRKEQCKINIFNISKITSEVRGGKAPRIKRLSEYIGQSYFDYLAKLDDLVLLMDESHRYRASAGLRAINELKPILGLELTATPIVETPKGPVRFQNVVYDYPLARAMEDGFVKEPAVVTRPNFQAAGTTPDEIERLKLEDGISLHEATKVDLETYALREGVARVKPFVLVIARDTTHAASLVERIKSDKFFSGRYADKVIQVDSSKSGADEEEMIRRLLAIEDPSEPTEIVVHVNMLKEGWDVTNLYTIIPLRAANARILIEQSIGRGLRLPYGKRTGVSVVDTLNIVAHDRFDEILEEAKKPDSVIRVKSIILGKDRSIEKQVTVVSQSTLANELGLRPDGATQSTLIAGADEAAKKPVFTTPEEQEAAKVAYAAIRKLENKPKTVTKLGDLQSKAVQEQLVEEVKAALAPKQLDLPGMKADIDIAAIVKKTAEMVVRRSIDIPRILVVPYGDFKCGFRPFRLDLSAVRYPAPSEELVQETLRTNQRAVLALQNNGGIDEQRLENYVVAGLIDFDDVSYDDNAELLYDLASQVVTHLRTYLKEEEVRRVLQVHQRSIADLVHAQMQPHYWEKVAGLETKIKKGFTELKDAAYTAPAADGILDFKEPVEDKSSIGKYLFGGFEKCLYPVQKFDSDTERKLAVILDRDALKWFRPVAGQFQIYYRDGAKHPEYQPDFVAEDEHGVYMLEPKMAKEMSDPIVLAKKNAAKTWCDLASDYSEVTGGKPWKYVLIPHDAVGASMSLKALVQQYGD